MQEQDQGHASESWRQLGGPIASRSNQLALWSAANLAGMSTRRLRVRKPFFRRVLNLIIGKHPKPSLRPRRPSPVQSLPLLADTLVGTTKSTIACVLGPPRSAYLDPSPTQASSNFWQAHVWYYPLPRHGPLAVAISFDEDYAQRVEFLEAPCATPAAALH